jgi:hypothetical protein
MSADYRSDAENSVLKPAGPYLIEKSYDSVAQSHKVIRPTVVRPTAAPSTTIAPFVRSTSPPKQR